MKRDPFGSAVIQCPRCNGARTINKADCPKCNGFGFIRHQFKLARDLAGISEAFNLAGECKPDTARLAREKKERAEAKAKAEQAQPGLF